MRGSLKSILSRVERIRADVVGSVLRSLLQGETVVEIGKDPDLLSLCRALVTEIRGRTEQSVEIKEGDFSLQAQQQLERLMRKPTLGPRTRRLICVGGVIGPGREEDSRVPARVRACGSLRCVASSRAPFGSTWVGAVLSHVRRESVDTDRIPGPGRPGSKEGSGIHRIPADTHCGCQTALRYSSSCCSRYIICPLSRLSRRATR